jgi:hypothetical protein
MRYISQIFQKAQRNCDEFPKCTSMNCWGIHDCCSVLKEAENDFLEYLRNRPEPKQKSATIPPSVNVRRD